MKIKGATQAHKGHLDFEDDEEIDIEFDDYDSPFTTDFCEMFPDHPKCRD